MSSVSSILVKKARSHINAGGQNPSSNKTLRWDSRVLCLPPACDSSDVWQPRNPSATVLTKSWAGLQSAGIGLSSVLSLSGNFLGVACVRSKHYPGMQALRTAAGRSLAWISGIRMTAPQHNVTSLRPSFGAAAWQNVFGWGPMGIGQTRGMRHGELGGHLGRSPKRRYLSVKIFVCPPTASVAVGIWLIPARYAPTLKTMRAVFPCADLVLQIV
jgi:hypothetical protein